jgi:hypothetical protein
MPQCGSWDLNSFLKINNFRPQKNGRVKMVQSQKKVWIGLICICLTAAFGFAEIGCTSAPKESPSTDDDDPSGDSDSDSDGDADSDSDGDADSDADGDSDSDADGDSDSDSDADSDGDTDGDSDGDTDSDSDTDTDAVVFQNGLDGYDGCEDTYLWMEKDEPQGANPELSVQGYHCASCIDQRVLIRFDLSSIEPSTNIESATLSLYSIAQPRPGDSVINVHRVSRSWDEATAGWYKASTGEDWTEPGGDFDSAFTSFNTTDELDIWNEVDITEVVQDFIRNPELNFGIILYMEVIMHTVEYASSDHATADIRPKLTIVME